MNNFVISSSLIQPHSSLLTNDAYYKKNANVNLEYIAVFLNSILTTSGDFSLVL